MKTEYVVEIYDHEILQPDRLDRETTYKRAAYGKLHPYDPVAVSLFGLYEDAVMFASPISTGIYEKDGRYFIKEWEITVNHDGEPDIEDWHINSVTPMIWKDGKLMQIPERTEIFGEHEVPMGQSTFE